MLSTYGGNLYAEVIVGRSSAPTEFYLALLDTLPGPDDSGTDIALVEPSGASYSRVLISTGAANWSAASDAACTYSNLIEYSPTEDWGTIIAYALCTASTGGYMVFYQQLSAPLTIKSGSTVQITSNNLSVGMVV